jgi:UDP-N-acetylglucosamine 2-epimerase (non-hydrolysing)
MTRQEASFVKIVNVVGARPNFVKISPLLQEMRRHPTITPLLVHTGQHYDDVMSEQFFAQLEIPTPDYHLGVGSGSHAVQTAEVMRRFEPVLIAERPDVVLVVGDVNSTVAAALTAVKLGIPVVHVEAGLRSFDRAMPEEINRVLTDAISERLFVTEEGAHANLVREGIAPGRIHFVGNVMVDALLGFARRWRASSICDQLRLGGRRYAVLTLHRPSNVDDPVVLNELLGALNEVSHHVPVLFPVHPRVKPRLQAQSSAPDGGVVYLPPLGYLDFVALMSRSCLVLTDSGGIQEETTALGVPCLTLRDTTERPVTVTHGTNRVVGTCPRTIVAEARQVLDGPARRAERPPLWDGRAAERIVQVLLREPADHQGSPLEGREQAALVTGRDG